MNKDCYIIAEAGVNHNGSLDLAKELVLKAKVAGADAVKLQSFKASSLVTQRAKKVGYQQETTEGGDDQLSMLKALELTRDEQQMLFQFGRSKGIDIFSTAFDLESLDYLSSLEPPLYKVPSGEITNVPMLQQLGKLGKPVIVSTGMATLGEVDFALQVLLAGGLMREEITVLHCSTQYPTPMEDVNLRAMLTLESAFPGVNVGYSDHTRGVEVAVAAVALGATVIEKHFTLDQSMEGPDHRASLEPEELAQMVSSIRNVTAALGDGFKAPTRQELLNRNGVRKSIVASVEIRKGETLNEQNLTTKRPASGIPANRWNEVLGRPACRDFAADECIEW
ncbi:MAG: N-acetylneuraminate synthase [Verrucomicrobiales bacterium]|nr:N-acetylneuraminate synthase [Verrucomicrobiales bacterium]